MTNNTKIDRVSMKQLGLRCYTATRHSALALQTFKRGQGLNLAAKGCRLLKDFFEDYGDPRITDSIASKWKSFLAFLREHQLKLNYFVVGYDGSDYLFEYEVMSTKYRNLPLRIRREIGEGIPFMMVPQACVDWLDEALDDVPYPMLLDVAAGN